MGAPLIPAIDMAKAARNSKPDAGSGAEPAPRAGAATLKDVAEFACVSKATVSRFVNNPGIVSPAARSKAWGRSS
ncbi:LacI family DNA-binding transcriptional regulator [Paraburkholderia tropica]|uniref:LacI family DNA-binding transcriptional regulator n=1 Tax=Paraburkholderia tropica TaxID=92647 RepID=UPI003CC69CFC